jgi:hypothetical protein
VCFVSVDLEVVHLDLSLGPGQSRLPIEDTWIMILICKRQCFIPRMSDSGAE